MKRLLSILLLLSIVVAAALFAREEPGYVLLSYGEWSAELTLVLFVLLTVMTLFILYYGLRFIFGLIHIPRDLARWNKEKKQSKAATSLSHGLILIAEGNWKKAEKELLKHVAHSESPLLNYIAAAQAAQGQGASSRRDDHLKKADLSTGGADIAVGLTQASLQLKEGQLEQALATLNRLRELDPKHPFVIKKLIELHLQLNDWKALLALLPQAKRRNAIDKQRAQQLESEAYQRLLRHKINMGNAVEVDTVWNALPSSLRKDLSVCEIYASYLHHSGKDKAAEAVIRSALKIGLTEKLAYLFGEIKSDSVGEQIHFAELINKKTPNSPMLTLTLGKLCLKAELWGKARDYLEKGIKLSNSAEAYQAMALYYSKMGNDEKVNKCYRDGLAALIKAAS